MKRRNYSKPKLALRDIQLAILAQAPPDFDKSKLPFMEQKAREYKPREKNKDGETQFSARLRKEFAQLYRVWKVKLLRNNVGRLQDRHGNYVTYGLGNGSPDNCGWRSITITPDMVGKHIAVFVGAEVKTDSDITDNHDQWQWLKDLHDAGGLAMLINAKHGEMHASNRIMGWRLGDAFDLPEPKRRVDELGV